MVLKLVPEPLPLPSNDFEVAAAISCWSPLSRHNNVMPRIIQMQMWVNAWSDMIGQQAMRGSTG